MIELALQILILLIGFVIIIKSADYFVDVAAAIGEKMGLSKIVIGVTIVAIGTSLPELFTSVVSILFTDNYSDFIIGTVMGSNITNILLVFGIFLTVAGTFSVKKRETLNVLFMLGCSVLLILFVLLGYVNYFAIILIIAYIFYTIYIARYQKKEVLEEEEEIRDPVEVNTSSYLILLGTVAGLFIGSRLVIGSIESIGDMLSIPTAYLSLTTIAVASSLPEVAVTISTAKKKEFLIGIGNVLGSNTANIAVVFGLSGFFGFYSVATELYLASIVFLVLTTGWFAFAVLRKRFYRVEGLSLLVLYLIFLASFFVL